METIGVLSLQGSFAEHLQALKKIKNIKSMPVKTVAELDAVDRLILPGGESTTMSKILNITGLAAEIRRRILAGMPVWGTCAGLILLAKELDVGLPHLAVMDMQVRRNAYGSQLDSFTVQKLIPKISSNPLNMVFIRAPQIVSISGTTEVLAEYDGKIVAAQQNRMLATTFHPELTDDLDVYNYFLKL
ncbi:MAG: pyridoxal 5'-phosphate synthase glutaminase subunit PdxT [Acidaminococcaceae bacterium]|nr:pyridoxal 5'-phosphate synthase glutaminase subunit PdxT [Acidaminococcaceae bacterium]